MSEVVELKEKLAEKVADLAASRARVKRFREALEKYGRSYHYGCEEDTWYNCPKHPDGCADPGAGTECNCGADRRNAEVKAILDDD